MASDYPIAIGIAREDMEGIKACDAPIKEVYGAVGITENMSVWGLPLLVDPDVDRGRWSVVWFSDLGDRLKGVSKEDRIWRSKI